MPNSKISLDNLSDDLLRQILQHPSLLPEETARCARVSKRWYNLARHGLFWNKKHQQHFPHRHKGTLSSQNADDVRWYDQFKDTYQTEYKKLEPNVRRLFSLVKEGSDSPVLQETLRKVLLNREDLSKSPNTPRNINPKDLLDRAKVRVLLNRDSLSKFPNIPKDVNGKSLLKWAEPHQAVLDAIYNHVVVPYFRIPTNQKKEKIEKWAKDCHQPFPEMALLLVQNNQLTMTDLINQQRISTAVEKGDLDRVKQLINENPSLLQSHILGNNLLLTALLLLASKKGHLNIVQFFLLEKGADIKAEYIDETCALSDEEASNNRDEFNRLAMKRLATEEAFPSLIGLYGTSLLMAAEADHLPTVKFLLKEGANIEATNGLGETALLVAVKKGHREILQFLIEKNANINAENTFHDNALHLASAKDDCDISNLFLAAEFDIEAKNTFNQTALHLAAGASYSGEKGSSDMVALLLAAGADPKAKTDRGETASSLIEKAGYHNIANIAQLLREQETKNTNCYRSIVKSFAKL